MHERSDGNITSSLGTSRHALLVRTGEERRDAFGAESRSAESRSAESRSAGSRRAGSRRADFQAVDQVEGLGPPPELITPERLLEASFTSDEPGPQARVLQEHLRLLAAAQARLDLGIGLGLDLLLTRHDLRELGHSHVSSFTEGRLGFSASHAGELRTLGRRLPALPALHDAFLAGLIPRTRLRSVLTVATPDDDAAWAQAARSMSSRQLERMVADVKKRRRNAPTDPGGDASGGAPSGGAPSGSAAELPEREHADVRVSWLGTVADRQTWHFGRAMARQVVGTRGPDCVLAEALAAEVLATHGHPEVSAEPSPSAEPPSAESGRRTASGAACRRRSGVPFKGRLLRQARKLRRKLARGGLRPAPDVPDLSTCESAGELLRGVLKLVRRRHVVEWERARLIGWVHARSLYRVLGFRSWGDWLRHGIDLSPRQAKGLLTLQRRLAFLPELDRAWREGRLSPHQVTQLARVVQRPSEQAWVSWATTVTPKMLDAAVEATLAGQIGSGEWAPEPPVGTPYRELVLDWRGRFGVRRKRSSAGATLPDAGLDDAPELRPRPPLSFRLGNIGFDATDEVALLWKAALEAVRLESGTVLADRDAVSRLIEHFLAVHVSDEVIEHARRHRAIERDGWTCAMPHCRSIGPFHEHHVVYRSQGGGDELDNLLTLCNACHAMLHDGHVVIRGTAPDDLLFLFGPGKATGGGPREAYRGELRVRVPGDDVGQSAEAGGGGVRVAPLLGVGASRSRVEMEMPH